MITQSIVVTGATGELGRIVVARLLTTFRCVVLYRTEESFRRLHTHPNLIGVRRFEALPEHAPFFGLVNLAGAFRAGSAPADLEAMFEANLLSAARAVDAVVPHLSDGGRIIVISAAASLTKPPGIAAYNASKAGLNAYIETVAKDVSARQIEATLLFPETIDEPERIELAEKIAALLVK